MMYPTHSVFKLDGANSTLPRIMKYDDESANKFYHTSKNLNEPLDFSKLKVATEYLLTIFPYAELAKRNQENKYYIPELGELLSHKKENFNIKLRSSLENARNRLNIAVAQEVFISGAPFFEMLLNNLHPEIFGEIDFISHLIFVSVHPRIM